MRCAFNTQSGLAGLQTDSAMSGKGQQKTGAERLQGLSCGIACPRHCNPISKPAQSPSRLLHTLQEEAINTKAVAATANKGPVSLPSLLQVRPNVFMGVAGGYQVQVLWVFNGRSTQWEQELPEATLQWLEKQRDATGPYRHYPNVHHTLEAPAPLINLLSQQASWAFRAKKAEVLEFVAAAMGSSSGPEDEVVKGNTFH